MIPLIIWSEQGYMRYAMEFMCGMHLPANDSWPKKQTELTVIK